MYLAFSDQPLPLIVKSSLFLAGPSPRSKDVLDWKKEAVELLKKLNFDGTVYIPVPKDFFLTGGPQSATWHYDNQIAWECAARARADITVFWVPRSIKGEMPAFTTNIEFGEDLNSGKINYGRPLTAEKCRYLDLRAKEIGAVIYDSLEEILTATVKTLGEGAYRVGGEVQVPLFVWQSEQFQSWYQQLKNNGNRLDEALVLSHFKLTNGELFSFTLKVKVWIAKEARVKDNEFIFSRKDISSVVAYHLNENALFLLLVKEFRSSVRNQFGYVYELPSGSASKAGVDAKENAQHELAEETGVVISDLERFVKIGERQLVSNLLTHTSSTYAVELTVKEVQEITEREHKNVTFGVTVDTEVTKPVLIDFEKLEHYPVDYSTIGQIYAALQQTKTLNKHYDNVLLRRNPDTLTFDEPALP